MSVGLFLSLVTLFHEINADDQNCRASRDGWNANFNFCPLMLQDSATITSQLPYYTVFDSRYEQDESSKYKYYFNVAGPVLKLPSEKCNYSVNQAVTCDAKNVDCTDPNNQKPIDFTVWSYRQECGPN
eukprot:361316_1